MKRYFNQSAIIFSILTFLFTVVHSAPRLIDYQGFLKASGSPVTDTLSMTFTIYDASSGGSSKWTETQSNVIVLGGLFNVTLGSNTEITDTVFSGNERWLQISIGGSPLSPRTRIVASAYGMRVASLDGANGGVVSGSLTAGKGNFGANSSNSGTDAFVAGQSNTVSGDLATVPGGHNNTVVGDSATVSGGASNVSSSSGAVVGGGVLNESTNGYATVSGGRGNKARGAYSTVGGGGGAAAADSNSASGTYSTVAGGHQCTASGATSFVGGGNGSMASGNDAVVAGGIACKASGLRSSVIGGEFNTASGTYSVVVGGAQSVAKDSCSLSFGWASKANHPGSVVISANSGGSASDSVRSGGREQMVLRGDGGLYITNQAGIAVYNSSRLINTSTGAYLSSAGDWENASDSTLKENWRPVDAHDILLKVLQLPVLEWNYKTSPDSIRHLGPTAQDFYRIFGLGESPHTISTIDPASVALVACKELSRLQKELENRVSKLEDLEYQVKELKKALNLLTNQVSDEHTDDHLVQLTNANQSGQR